MARGGGGKGSRSGGGGPALSASVRTISAAKAPGDRLSLLFARCCFRGVFFFRGVLRGLNSYRRASRRQELGRLGAAI